MNALYRLSSTAPRRMHQDLKVMVMSVLGLAADLAESVALRDTIVELITVISDEDPPAEEVMRDYCEMVANLGLPMGMDYRYHLDQLMCEAADLATIMRNATGELTISGCIAFARRLEAYANSLHEIMSQHQEWAKRSGISAAVVRIEQDGSLPDEAGPYFGLT